MNLHFSKFIVCLLGAVILFGCSSGNIPNTPTSLPATSVPVIPTISPTTTAIPLTTVDPSVSALPTFSFQTISGESPFEFVATLDEILPGSQAASFRSVSDGSIWMITDAGIARLSDSGWTVYLSKHEGHFVGMDSIGRAWSINPTNMVTTGPCAGPSGPCEINPHMDSISAWDGTKWTKYASESGWTSFSVDPHSSPDFFMAELDGQIWISTSVDVRVFDGSRWRVIKLEEIGLTLPLSIVRVQAFTGTKEVWVTGCYFTYPPPHRSEIYWNDRSKWENRSVPEDSGCIYSMQEDRQGNVWWAVDNTLWRFTRATKQWVKFTPPAPSSSPNYISALALNKAGEPWLTVWSNGSTLYHLQNDVWSPIIPLNSGSGAAGIFIDSADRVWIPTRAGIYQIINDQPKLVSHLIVSARTMDATGKIWAVGRDSSNANRELSLWVVNP
jgi:hypothetical protein